MDPRGSKGTTLLEMLLVLGLLLWVVHGAWKVGIVHRKAGAAVARRAEALETVRTLAWLLPQEISMGRSGVDWWTGGQDSLSLRAFRGTAMVLPGSGSGRELTICYRGIRAPDPEKDSLLVLGADGGWRARDLVDRIPRSRECLPHGMGREEVWTLDALPGDPVMARLFERGSYHFNGGALRYRRGEGGRQPLTPERIESGRFLGTEGQAYRFGWIITLEGGWVVPTGTGGWSPGVWRGRGW